MRYEQFGEKCIYHVFSRGVDKRTLCKDAADYRRFYESLCLFNNSAFSNPGGNSSLGDEGYLALDADGGGKPLVNVMAFCLMPNHFHLLLEQLVDGGIQKFMHKVGMGHAKYFNKRYERTGRLFESNFKAVLVENDSQLWHLPRYIHLNALDLTDLEWRDGKVEDWDRAQRFLDSYEWSSHQFYQTGSQKLPVVRPSILSKIIPSGTRYSGYLRDWGGRHTLNQKHIVS